MGYNKGNAGLAQFLPNGKIDLSFGVNGIASTSKDLDLQGLGLALSPDNKIIAGYKYTDAADNKKKTCLAKFNANGILDKSFGIKGIVFNKEVITTTRANMAIAIQPNGKIVEYVSTTRRQYIIQV